MRIPNYRKQKPLDKIAALEGKLESCEKAHDKLRTENEKLEQERDGLRKECIEVEQRLGKALGYPTEGPEVGGDHSTICIGPHTPGTIAAEATKRIAKLEAALRFIDKNVCLRGNMSWEEHAREIQDYIGIALQGQSREEVE